MKLRDEVRELEDEYDDSVYDRWILEHQYRMAVARMQERDPEGIAWLDDQVRRWESRREGFLEDPPAIASPRSFLVVTAFSRLIEG